MKRYPVVFFVYKRPKKTEKLLLKIIENKPSKIYIFSDGPKNSDDQRLNNQVLSIIDNLVKNNPKIKIIKDYSTKNLGLKNRIISGLDEVFIRENAAIIVEDDCLPTNDFFKFASEMLTKYANNQKIFSINGSTTGGLYKYSYEFSKYPQCWGWATWKRSWKYYDPKLVDFNKENWNKLATKLNFNYLLSTYWYYVLHLVKMGWTNTWDYQWSYTHFKFNGLAISPSVNMITNIGFDSAATNTKTKSSVAERPVQILKWPLSEPKTIKENMTITRTIEKSFYQNPIAILGLIRQYIYWAWETYVNRH